MPVTFDGAQGVCGENPTRGSCSFYTRVRGKGRTSASRQQFNEEVEIIKIQIAQLRHRWIVHPRNSRWTQQWDVALFVCISFTAVVTPFEIGIVPMQTVWDLDAGGMVLFGINRVVDIFFLADPSVAFGAFFPPVTIPPTSSCIFCELALSFFSSLLLGSSSSAAEKS